MGDDMAPMDNGLLGFTETSQDPMAFVSGGDAAALSMDAPSAVTADPFQGMPVKEAGGSMGGKIPEQNALREWEDKHEKELEDMSRKEVAKKEERRKVAAEALAKWKQEQAETASKRQATNRSNEASTEKSRLDAMKPGANPWERVVELIDTSAPNTTDESRDTSRMRSLLIQLKSNPVIAAA
mmetsp:Transcript_57064/g.92438  ORF Transcript_57064/g.92438 Transcript_57064/m.92438 type:complete len:183 (-) Transcript_57064:56-604(-)